MSYYKANRYSCHPSHDDILRMYDFPDPPPLPNQKMAPCLPISNREYPCHNCYMDRGKTTPPVRPVVRQPQADVLQGQAVYDENDINEKYTLRPLDPEKLRAVEDGTAVKKPLPTLEPDPFIYKGVLVSGYTYETTPDSPPTAARSTYPPPASTQPTGRVSSAHSQSGFSERPERRGMVPKTEGGLDILATQASSTPAPGAGYTTGPPPAYGGYPTTTRYQFSQETGSFTPPPRYPWYSHTTENYNAQYPQTQYTANTDPLGPRFHEPERYYSNHHSREDYTQTAATSQYDQQQHHDNGYHHHDSDNDNRYEHSYVDPALQQQQTPPAGPAGILQSYSDSKFEAGERASRSPSGGGSAGNGHNGYNGSQQQQHGSSADGYYYPTLHGGYPNYGYAYDSNRSGGTESLGQQQPEDYYSQITLPPLNTGYSYSTQRQVHTDSGYQTPHAGEKGSGDNGGYSAQYTSGPPQLPIDENGQASATTPFSQQSYNNNSPSQAQPAEDADGSNPDDEGWNAAGGSSSYEHQPLLSPITADVEMQEFRSLAESIGRMKSVQSWDGRKEDDDDEADENEAQNGDDGGGSNKDS